MDYTLERENNIIKNIAKEIVVECALNGYDIPQELADYLVKLKLLNPKNGFTASEVMPRSLTQQLVMLVVEDLKQNTPAMNCIQMQVYWKTVNLHIPQLKAEYVALQSEKADPYLPELLLSEKDDPNSTTFRNLAYYILISQNLGNINNAIAVRETLAAVHSVIKTKQIEAFYSSTEEQKIQKIKTLTKRITGIRLFLKSVGKAGEGIEDVRNLVVLIEECKNEMAKLSEKIEERIDGISFVIPSIVAYDYLFKDLSETADVLLPPEFDINDLKYLKQVNVIMHQHKFYISDLLSKLDEIDGDVSFYLKKLNETLTRLQLTIQDRDMIPTSEIYDDFSQAGELWEEIVSYYHCLECVKAVSKRLEDINKKEYFAITPLEKAFHITSKSAAPGMKKESLASTRTGPPSSIFVEMEDFQLEFQGFCAWTLYFAEGHLLQGLPAGGFYQYNDQYYAFASKAGQEMWSKDPFYYLLRIYEFMRLNPEFIGLLNAYETLYNSKSLQLEKKTDRKISLRTESVQTVVHPIEKHWDKDYTFSVWELKKRALILSRLTKCVTKSSQTVNHSHFRSAIGITAAPDKDKEVQTKRDNSCVHPTIQTYLYGLRGHKDDKFRVVTLTRPLEETCQREIILERIDKCKERYGKKVQSIPAKTSSCEFMYSLGSGCQSYDGEDDGVE